MLSFSTTDLKNYKHGKRQLNYNPVKLWLSKIWNWIRFSANLSEEMLLIIVFNEL